MNFSGDETKLQSIISFRLVTLNESVIVLLERVEVAECKFYAPKNFQLLVVHFTRC